MNNEQGESEQGFTLIEVLVALTILSISFGVLFSVVSSALDRTHTAAADGMAVSLARSLLDDLGRETPITEGVSAGRFANGYSWRLRVEPYGAREDQGAWPVRADDVVATVTWLDGSEERSISLQTLRLSPKSR